MEWVEDNYCVTKSIHEVSFNNEFIIGLLKMWSSLLAQKYTFSNSNIWLNVGELAIHLPL